MDGAYPDEFRDFGEDDLEIIALEREIRDGEKELKLVELVLLDELAADPQPPRDDRSLVRILREDIQSWTQRIADQKNVFKELTAKQAEAGAQRMNNLQLNKPPQQAEDDHVDMMGMMRNLHLQRKQ